MRHRSYHGKVLYLTDDIGEMGREWFYVTIQPGGTRTMRATCEMDNDRLVRDVVMTVDANWYPVDAFVRLTINEALVGTSWFYFTDNSAECQAYTSREGRISQSFETDKRTRTFGAHPVHGDAWGLAGWKRDKKIDENGNAIIFSSSHLPNGGSGPYLHPIDPTLARINYIGFENVTVPAGTFYTEHFQFLVGDYPPIDIWSYSDDCIPVRLRWDLLNQSYDLVELDYMYYD